jgi:ABC-type polar amino acid transport system ATPase subunit
LLVARDLDKTFGRKKALRGVSCQIDRGGITAVIGPSGSGKSTLLRALSLIDPPDSGTIDVEGRVYRYPADDSTRQDPPWPLVTVVFQQLFLWPHLSLRDNITMPARLGAVPDVESKLSELLQAFDMVEFIDRYPNQTSLGQRQRAAIARALILEPHYLLLDEVTSSLDIESVAAIVRHLAVLKQRGMGVLLITHSLGLARGSADRIVFLDDGEALESGGSDILDRPQHARLKAFLDLLEQVR